MIKIKKVAPEFSNQNQRSLHQIDCTSIVPTNESLPFEKLKENSDFIILSQKLFYEILSPWESVFKKGLDPYYDIYDCYDTMFLREAMAILKNQEVTKEEILEIGKGITYLGPPNPANLNANQANSSGASVNNSSNNNSSHIIRENRSIPRCNLNSRKILANSSSTLRTNSSHNNRQHFDIPHSIRHFVPVGSEHTNSNFINWNFLDASQTLKNERLEKLLHNQKLANGQKRQYLNSSSLSKRLISAKNQSPHNLFYDEKNHLDSKISNKNLRTTSSTTINASNNDNTNNNKSIFGYNRNKTNKKGPPVRHYKFQLKKNYQEYLDDYKSQVVEPELLDYHEIMQNEKYEKYRQNWDGFANIYSS